jgi:8-oxo-dGTP pyrophosphatase MutT (NUDIX family)
VPPPRRLKSELSFRHPFIDLHTHELETATGSRSVITFAMPDWVAIAATDTEGRFVLVRQHRHGIDADTLEPAGGLVDPGEAPERAALRELEEETGYRAAAARSLGWVHPNPALQDNRCHLFLAERAERVGEPLVAEDEETAVEVLEAADLRTALYDGRITHALAVLALTRALEELRGGG